MKAAMLRVSTEPPCKGCQLDFEREEYEGRFWHVWEGRAYPCTREQTAAVVERGTR